MRYRVTHTTEYTYGEIVPLCHNMIRLRPRETERQRLISSEVAIDPAPATHREGIDFFGNHVTWFSVQEPHQGLAVTSRSEVDVTAGPADVAVPSNEPWESVRQSLVTRLDPATLSARQYIYESPHVPRSANVHEYARASFLPGRPLYDCVADLMGRIHADFRFVAGATCVGTTVEDVLRLRQGVCQDFSHLMITCIRSMGLAARYVSGYLVTVPAPGTQKLVGVDASHAWLSVFFPDGMGWLDFDPTNNVCPAEQHVTVAWARDYDDVAPVKGVIIGGHQHGLRVSVDVSPVAIADPL
jgi:transglutaminase-like putative cysteine protease